MAANIYTDAQGRSAVVSLRKSMWHGQGTVVDQEMTDDEILKAALLDYEILKDPLFVKPDPTQTDIAELEGWCALRRSDTGVYFGCVGEGFRVYQNSELIALMRRLAGDSSLIWETAGALGPKGQQVWCMARLPELTMALGNDTIDSYMLLTNGHGNNRALTVMPTAVRVVCENTLRMATEVSRKQRFENAEVREFSTYELATGYSINHTRGLDTIVNEVAGAYSRIVANKESTQSMFETLAAKPMSLDDARHYWSALLPVDNLADEKVRAKNLREAREQALDRIWASGTNKGMDTQDTVFSAYQTLVEFVDHEAYARSDATRFNKAVFGSGASLKREAMEAALDLVGS